MQGMVVHDESAHPRQEASAGAAKGGSWGARVLDWARDVRANLRAGHSAFLSMRENAAQGVQVGTAKAIFSYSELLSLLTDMFACDQGQCPCSLIFSQCVACWSRGNVQRRLHPPCSSP